MSRQSATQWGVRVVHQGQEVQPVEGGSQRDGDEVPAGAKYMLELCFTIFKCDRNYVCFRLSL